MTSNKTNSAKNALFTEAYFALHNASIQKFTKEALTTASKGVFSSLKSVLTGDSTYKVYTKYGEDGINLIDKISSKYNLNKTDVYNAFVNSGVTKTQMEDNAYVLSYQIGTGEDIFSDPWVSDNNMIKALAAIKQLM